MKIISFYLPQFHPIPENDKWWGTGFTEWRNVVKAKPLFQGHSQPHIPADLGFYDLRLEETRIAQAELAREHGIYGFCYYHYWFNGKMLLDRPFNEVLVSGKPDFPFCLCWANENWTRTWDGMDQEILIRQDYDNYDPAQHIDGISAAFSDKRYIKIFGKPLYLIYDIGKIPNIKEIITQWKRRAKLKGHSDIYLCAVKSHQLGLRDEEIMQFGFDGIVDFQPHPRNLPVPTNDISKKLNLLVNILIDLFHIGKRVKKRSVFLRYKYSEFVNNVMSSKFSQCKTFPCVFPGWDNSPRKDLFATVIQNDDEKLFGKWLRYAFSRVINYPVEEHIIFINAWNEWAEGCHLEPDLRNGKKFLRTVSKILREFEH